MKKRSISTILTLAMVISMLGVNIIAPTTVQAETTINIGDYVQMGSYYDEAILWRCVDIDATNGQLMLADRILTIKAFDAAGNHKYLDGTAQNDYYGYRTSCGSDLWETSNMRSWLNSTATTGNVTWLDGCPPTAANLWNGYNAYATEKGFMADGNFTASERNAIKSVTQKSLLNGIDQNKLKVGGTAEHMWDYNIATVVQNYDTAYYDNVTDNMFLLDVKQVNKVYQNSSTLGTNYYIGKPTQKAVDNNEYKNSGISIDNKWYYWLRSPHAGFFYGFGVRWVDSGGGVGGNGEGGCDVGARPAFFINLSSVIFKSGNGSENTPYVADTAATPTPTPTPTPTATPTPTYTVTVNAGNHGSVVAVPVSATVYEGQTVTFTITPDAGNYISSVKFNDAEVLTSYVNSFTYTTPALTANATLDVTFAVQPTTGRVAPWITAVLAAPTLVNNQTFTDLKDSSGNAVDLGTIAKSYYNYYTISNPDAYTLSSYGMKLTDVTVGSLTYGKVIYFAATKNYNGNFAALVFGDAFTNGNDYTLQGYLKYTDEATKTVYSPLMPFTY